ncbi:RNA polymerase sigma-70 factor [Rufibacter glacialis]|uniref:RNA polymerase sigma-70 factor n=1 Tax=Rufibacter glacialis TaxID=1259555 RepID=A0A5M8QB65_9BACT|nr:RNA polymerase sigma-70 factor [Rufibacter glacialis]KAA6431762.1 RNA polymerase sigma-70 factor [Rufibacter glacialis]GGK81781.1 DNA-directed RNA polymerase sigma-70 factor [Rufibacter glacialis]
MGTLPLTQDHEFHALLKTNEALFMETLFKQYYTVLCRTAVRFTKDTEAAEDLVQEVFCKIWQNREVLDVTSSYKAYLVRSVTNQALNYIEKQKRLVLAEDTLPYEATMSANTTMDLLAGTEMEERINKALSALPPQCRLIFEMSRFEELTYKEIADSLHLSPKTIENQMGKALRILREHLLLFLITSAFLARFG